MWEKCDHHDTLLIQLLSSVFDNCAIILLVRLPWPQRSPVVTARRGYMSRGAILSPEAVGTEWNKLRDPAQQMILASGPSRWISSLIYTTWTVEVQRVGYWYELPLWPKTVCQFFFLFSWGLTFDKHQLNNYAYTQACTTLLSSLTRWLVNKIIPCTC